MRKGTSRADAIALFATVAPVKVFISWSGQRSRTFAEFLKTWLEQIVPNGVEAFVSSQNIEKGSRGLNTIAQELEAGDYGVIVTTADTQHAPWIGFEAGALSKSVSGSHVAPLLIDLAESDVTGPLAQFQMTRANDRVDVRKLVDDLNSATGNPVPDASLNILFDSTWDAFSDAVRAAQTPIAEVPEARGERDMLAELLDHVRDLRRDMRRAQQRDRRELARQEAIERDIADELSFWLNGRTSIRFTYGSGSKIVSADVSIAPGSTPDPQPDGARMQELADRWNIAITVYSDAGMFMIRPDMGESDPAATSREDVAEGEPEAPGAEQA